jgi:lysyl-tRNA synthetase class II
VAESPNFLRLISPIKKRKGTISFFGMAANGMEQFYEFQRRNLSKETMNELLGLQRGDLIQVEGVLTVSEDGRIRLTEANRLLPLFAPRVGVNV